MKQADYWAKQIKKMKQGDITPKELAEDAATYMKAIGMVESPLIGWAYRKDLERAGIREKWDRTPSKSIVSEDGHKRVVHPKFMKYLETRTNEDRELIEEGKANQETQELFSEDLPF